MGASVDLLSFLYPCWTGVRARVRLGIDASMLVMVAVLLKIGNFVEISASNLSAEDLAKVIFWVNGSIQITLIIIAVITIGDAILEIRRLLRANHAKPAPILTA